MSATQLKVPFRIVLLLAVLVNCGCAIKMTQLYAGERRPRNEVAIIEPWSRFDLLQGYGIRTYLVAVDDQPLGEGAAEVLPGRHSITSVSRLFVGYEQTTFRPEDDLVVDSKAGHTYQVRAHFPGASLFDFAAKTPPAIWIEEKASGEVVAGDRPE